MPYAQFVGRRLLQAIPVLIGVTMVVFLMVHLVPGDPARSTLGTHATPEAVAQLRHEWGLDRSLPEQYFRFFKRLLAGDLGTSLRYGQSAGSVVLQAMPVTLWLIGYSMVLSCLIAVPLALIASSRPGGWGDKAIRLVSVAGLGVPTFWLGIMFVEFVAVEAQLLPASGFGEGFFGHLESLLLPSLTIAAGIAPLLIRSLRAELLHVAGSDYVLTARSKGLSESRIRVRHVLRNALAPSVTLLALTTGFLLGGTVVVEHIFGLGGLGELLLKGIYTRDFPMVQAITLILACLVVFVNILGDLIQALIDPRVDAQ